LYTHQSPAYVDTSCLRDLIGLRRVEGRRVWKRGRKIVISETLYLFLLWPRALSSLHAGSLWASASINRSLRMICPGISQFPVLCCFPGIWALSWASSGGPILAGCLCMQQSSRQEPPKPWAPLFPHYFLAFSAPLCLLPACSTLAPLDLFTENLKKTPKACLPLPPQRRIWVETHIIPSFTFQGRGSRNSCLD
jgi:hypothetical protein